MMIINNIKNKYKKMDEFLKLWRNVAIENPNIDMKSDSIKTSIYRSLVRVGINEKETEVDLSVNHIFDNLCNYYKGEKNIRVFVSPSWKYFCQFQNKPENLAYGKSEAIKIYIPVDSKHIEQSAKNIFSFLSENDIAFMGKIGKNIRVDDIVVRLANQYDAKRLLDFIKKDKYIQKGLIEPNAFAYSNDNIAMACDRRLSYNSTISSLISIYLENARQEKTLNNVNLSHFVKFVINYYQERFITFKCQGQTLSDFNQDKNIEDLTEEEICSKIINLKEIITLFLKTMNNDFNIENYFAHFEENQKNHGKNIETLKKIRKEQNIKKQEENQINIETYFYEIIDTFKEKQYTKEYMYKALEAYIKTGEKKYLTNTNNLRNKISSSNFREELIFYLRTNNISLENIFELMLQVYDEKIVENAVIKTYEKYQQQYIENKIAISGENWVIGAIKNVIQDKNYNCFTRDDNVREKLITRITPEKLIEIMKRKTNLTFYQDNYEIAKSYFNQIYLEKIRKEEKINNL